MEKLLRDNSPAATTAINSTRHTPAMLLYCCGCRIAVD
jgi:hypothetical protein